MILPDRPRTLLGAVKRRRRPHGETHDVLQEKQHCSNGANVGVGGVEVREFVDVLVVFDDGDAGDEGEEGDEMESGVDTRAGAFLIGGVRWL